MTKKASILIIYTGGTIGMIEDSKSKALIPMDFKHIESHIPEFSKLNCKINTICFEKPIDSSEVTPEIWIKLANVINDNYSKYDGFVILHGTDTMSYSASALSFMLENLNKPIIFTGSQLPLGIIRNDGRENLITAIELACAKENEKAIIPEVCVYFQNKLFRGNRTHKTNSENFAAFQSANYPMLAEAGVHIYYNKPYILKQTNKKFNINCKLDNNIAILKIFPGIPKTVVNSILNIKNLKAVILETYGSGNAITEKWFINELKTAIDKGLFIINVSQCEGGKVEQGKYGASYFLAQIGVISGKDITVESAIAKTMYVLGQNYNKEKTVKLLSDSLRGEINS